MGGRTSVAGSDKRELLERLLRDRAQRSTVEYPLSYNQRSLWFTYCLAPESAAYNVPFAWRVTGPLDAAALRRALERIVARHAILRTTYSSREPLQRVHEAQQVDFGVVDATTWSEQDLDAAMSAEMHQPFDLEHGPVLRTRLWQRGASESVLLVTFHHIAYDLWSMTTFVSDLLALYAGEKGAGGRELPPIAYQYSDFVRWQADMIAADGERLWEYWRQRLAGPLPVLALPTDRPRPPVQTYAGAMYSRAVPADLAQGSHTLAHAADTTLFTVLLAAFEVLLAQLSGQRDVVVGSPIFGRSRAEFEPLIGYFLNTLPLRADLSGDPDIRTLLGRTHQVVRGALEHQDYPIELLAERLKPARSASQAALFQTMFVLNRPRQFETGSIEGGELAFEVVPLARESAQFDLSLEVDQLDDELVARWEYNTDLFDEATIVGWARDFERILAHMIADPSRALSDLFDVAAGSRAPENELEELVAQIFCEVLGREQVDVRASLFDLGGGSMSAARILTRLNALAGTNLGLKTVFEAPTVRTLARRLEEVLLTGAG